MQGKPDRIQMGERGLQFFEFGSGSMDLEADELGQVQRLGKHRANILEMREQRLSVHITFAAKNFVAVDAELIEEVADFVARFCRNSGKNPFRKSS
jgi:hypothetical protein